MTKSITILSLLIIIALGGIAYFLFFSKTTPELDVDDKSPEQILETARQNAFRNATVHNEQGGLIVGRDAGVTTYLLVDQITYQIVYDQEPRRYRILIASRNFEEVKKQAEEDFLSLVGLNPEDACSLNLQILVLRASQTMTPSYCL